MKEYNKLFTKSEKQSNMFFNLSKITAINIQPIKNNFGTASRIVSKVSDFFCFLIFFENH